MVNIKNNLYTEQDIEKVISLIEETRSEYPKIAEVVDKMVEDATPNFWDIIFHKTSAVNLVKKAHEIRYSAMLAWLANPNENHKLGNMFVRELLSRKFEDNPKELAKINKYFADRNKESVSVYNEFEDIDVYYKNEGNNAHVAIEVKQYALEHNKSNKDFSQLAAYKKVVDREADSIDKNNSCKYFLFLTPLGEKASEGNESWISVDYADVIFVLDKMIAANHDLDFVKIVKDFKQELERTSMNLDFDALKVDLQEFNKETRDLLKDFTSKLEKDIDLSQDFNKVLFDKGLNIEKMRESLNLISNSLYTQDHSENTEVQDFILKIIGHFTNQNNPQKSTIYEVDPKFESDLIFDKVATTRGKGQGLKFFYDCGEDNYWTYFSGDSKGLVPNDGFGVFRNKDLIYKVKIDKIEVEKANQDFTNYINDFTQALIELSDYVKEDIKNN